MPIPSQPSTLIPRPFASDGSGIVIPETKAASGRASYAEGFPVETQQPLAHGGIAPNRRDFNGIMHLLTSFGFWQQSGGQWSYTPALNYTTPNIVFHKGVLWWCLKDNGPDTADGAAGVVEPGTDEDVWQDLLRALAVMGGTSAIGNPVGTVITYAATTPPEGYFPCDGRSYNATAHPQLYAVLGSTTVPDMRGLFVRGYDTRNSVDPDGGARTVRSVQGDAIRNITGFVGGTFYHNAYATKFADGPFRQSGSVISGRVGRPEIDGWFGCSMDLSLSVPTAPENRPRNINLLYCIKHD